MWERRDLKRAARGTLKRSYFGILITCTLVAIIMGCFSNPLRRIEAFVVEISELRELNTEADKEIAEINSGTYKDPDEYTGEEADEAADGEASDADVVLAPTARQETVSNDEITDRFLSAVGIKGSLNHKWTKGVLSVVANNVRGAGSLLYGVMNMVNQFMFKERLSQGVIITLGTFIGLLILIFIKNVLSVGYCRYLLEMRRYSETRINRVLFSWYIKRGWKTVKVMFIRTLLMTLWWFTIVGGFIKQYSYRMVPYIMAENPDIGVFEAITLSRKMMNGNKWKAFLLDVSFLPWYILDALTFGLLRIFFFQPYMDLTGSELYMTLRQNIKATSEPETSKLCDGKLDIASVCGDEYPVADYMIPPYPRRRWAHADYNRKYSLTSLILIFFAFSFVGWVWEVSIHLFKNGVFVNRGVMYGPWLPIYGAGGTMVLIVLKKLRDKPLLTFLTTMVLCGIVEYFTSWYLEKTNGMRWWDYSGYFLNINGRICLEGLLVFALGGCAAIYLIAPALDNIFNRIPKKIKITVCAVLISAFLGDSIYAHFVPNTGKGITDY